MTAIAVVDIGWGGLSVLSHLMQESFVDEAEFLYFNIEDGYNSEEEDHPDDEDEEALTQQQRAFSQKIDHLLRYLETRDPDIVLLACNTLSVLFPTTAYAAKDKADKLLNVLSIVDEWTLSSMPSGANVLIFGTAITVKSDVHRRQAIHNGIDPKCIVAQACNMLATTIQGHGAESAETRKLVAAYVETAWKRLLDQQRGEIAPTTIVVTLCCTHYGYAFPVWEEALQSVAAKHSGVTFNIIDHALAFAKRGLRLQRDLCKPPSSLSKKMKSAVRVFSDTGVTPEEIHLRSEREIKLLTPLLTPTVAKALQTCTEVDPICFGVAAKP